MKNCLTVASTLALASLAGCDSSSSSDGPSSGVFLDSAVISIGYRTESLSGVTGPNGEYEFLPGETVTFFIGDLEFPPSVAKGVVTPLDLAGSEDVNDDQVVNMLRLLQTLDADGDASNGITITDIAKDNATAIDFDRPIADFENDAAVTTLISNGGQDTPPAALVTVEEAVDSFQETLRDEGVRTGIVGSWLATEDDENDLLLFNFLNDGRYTHAEVDADDPEEDDGMEYGTYSRDQETGELTVTQTFDQNDTTGLTDFANGQGNVFANVDGDVLTFDIDENGDGQLDDTVTFTRTTADGLFGTWLARPDNENDLLLFNFLDDGRYVHHEVELGNPTESSGMEYGNLAIDPATGRVSVEVLFDGNGDTGLSDFENENGPQLFAEVVDNVLMLDIDEDANGVIDDELDLDRR